jgi:hypothetical protein
MSYGFTVYTDRESIATTKVYSQTSGITYTYAYGTGQHSSLGFSDGHYLKFTAEPADGYEFYRWVYHIGSPTATEQYVYANEDEDDPSTFIYYGSEGNDIYIAAEGRYVGSGEPEEPEVKRWSMYNGGDLGIIEGHTTRNVWLMPSGVFVYSFKFAKDGYASFYTTYASDIMGEYNTYGQLSIISDFDDINGCSYVGLASDDNSGDGYNFSFTYYVYADTTYYLWVRSKSHLAETGATYMHIIPPISDDYFEWSSAVYSGGVVKNVSHTEWDNFIDKIKEVLTDKGILNQAITAEKYGYDIGTTYNTMINDCYLEYDSDLQGYPLTAQQFNVARFIIGSHVSTNLEEPEKISRQSEVLAADFFKLSRALRTWQG